MVFDGEACIEPEMNIFQECVHNFVAVNQAEISEDQLALISIMLNDLDYSTLGK